jgi:hypothetical protein
MEYWLDMGCAMNLQHFLQWSLPTDAARRLKGESEFRQNCPEAKPIDRLSICNPQISMELFLCIYTQFKPFHKNRKGAKLPYLSLPMWTL